MDTDTREAIRSNLHHIDLLLRKLDRKAVAVIEQVGLLQGLILDIKELTKPIYRLLDSDGGADRP